MSSIFKCRIIKPSVASWIEVPGDDADEVANKFYSKLSIPQSTFKYKLDDGSYANFVLYEVENVEGITQFVGRWFTKGITRKGSFNSGPQTLKQIAEQLNWSKDPNELLAHWDGEEPEWYNSLGAVVNV